MILVGTDSGVYGFTQENGTWRRTSAELDGVAVCDLAVDPSSPGRVMAAARETGIFETVDHGATWAQVADDLDPWSVDVASDGTAIAGARPSSVYRQPVGGSWAPLNLLTEQPAYGSWSFPVPPHLPNIRDIAFSPTDAHTIYAAVEVGGLLVSNDDGATWENFREGVHLDIHSITAAEGDDDVIYAATGRGFYRSFSAGRQWESACNGLAGLYLVPLVAHPTDAHTLITSATNGRPRYWRRRPSGAEAVIYRSHNGGSNWQPVMNGLPEQLVGAVAGFATDPAHADVLYAAAEDGHVFASNSFGDEWEIVATDLPPARAIAALD
jgi:photosystem II stability/assembly factor-like uncharacterized protein